MKSDYNILVTGGAGYLGSYLIKYLLKSNLIQDQLVVYSRDELKHFNLKISTKSDARIRYVIGDVRDRSRLVEAMQGIDIVIHAAAMKQVGTCEANPSECVKTNIQGTENVLKAARETGVGQLIFLSTDKAVEPISVYGNSKQVGEKLCLNAHEQNFQTVVLRHGNMIGSTGSIVDRLQKQNDQPIMIPSDEITRFSDSPANCWKLIQEVIKGRYGGTVLVPKLQGVNIYDLARAYSDQVALDDSGICSYEKMHEKLLSEKECQRVLKNESMYIVPAQAMTDDEGLELYGALNAGLRAYESNEVAVVSPKAVSCRG